MRFLLILVSLISLNLYANDCSELMKQVENDKNATVRSVYQCSKPFDISGSKSVFKNSACIIVLEKNDGEFVIRALDSVNQISIVSPSGFKFGFEDESSRYLTVSRTEGSMNVVKNTVLLDREENVAFWESRLISDFFGAKDKELKSYATQCRVL